MPSPFPGMNPYLERPSVWRDFHGRFISALNEALAPQIGPLFSVHVERELFFHERSSDSPILVKRPNRRRDSAEDDKSNSSRGTGPLNSPCRITVNMDFDIDEHLFLTVKNGQERSPLAVIETISPSLKEPGPDREQYLAKRRRLLHSHATFVEIDLLRGGLKMSPAETSACDYSVIVSHYRDRPFGGCWPIMLHERLPIIPIPIGDPVSLAHLDLQEILHTVYDQACYKDTIYQGLTDLPLAEADRVWAEELAKHAQTSSS
jgi:hypothetical protein